MLALHPVLVAFPLLRQALGPRQISKSDPCCLIEIMHGGEIAPTGFFGDRRFLERSYGLRVPENRFIPGIAERSDFTPGSRHGSTSAPQIRPSNTATDCNW